MRVVVCCATFAAIAFPSLAGGQSLSLTESDALSRLSAESPRVRAIRAGVDIARVDVLAAGRWPNPRVTYDREAVAGNTEHMVMVAQPLPITGRRGLEVNAASAIVAASASRSEDEIRRLRADLRLAFAELVGAQIREREFTAARDRLRQLTEVLIKRERPVMRLASTACGPSARSRNSRLTAPGPRSIGLAHRARCPASLLTSVTRRPYWP